MEESSRAWRYRMLVSRPTCFPFRRRPRRERGEGPISRIIDMVASRQPTGCENQLAREGTPLDVNELRHRLLAAGLPVLVQIRLPVADTLVPPAGAALYGNAILSALRVALAGHPCRYADDGFEIRYAKVTIPLNPILRDGAADRVGCIAAVIACLQALDYLNESIIGYRWHTDWHVAYPTDFVGAWHPFSNGLACDPDVGSHPAVEGGD